MAKLSYSAIASLDGYVADEDGNFDWAAPGEEVHGFINDLERSVGTYLYGRRMYETMAVWETDAALAARSEVTRDFAQIWQSAKIVYSKTLERPATAKTRIERDFDPEAVRQMKTSAGSDLTVGRSGPRSRRVQGGIGGGMPPVPRTDRRWRWQAVASRRCPLGARTAGRTPLRRRHGLPALPSQSLRALNERSSSKAQGLE